MLCLINNLSVDLQSRVTLNVFHGLSKCDLEGIFSLVGDRLAASCVDITFQCRDEAASVPIRCGRPTESLLIRY